MAGGNSMLMNIHDQRSARHDALLRVGAAVTLEAFQQEIIVDIPAGSIVITLPSIAESTGRTYSFYVGTDAGGDVDVQGRGDEMLDFATTAVLKAINDFTIIKNVAGLGWVVLSELSTP